MNASSQPQHGERIRIRGLVQGVGFRPTVWRLAREQGLVGDVLNDGDGVLVRAWGGGSLDIDNFCRSLLEQCPPLARIDVVERSRLDEPPPAGDFRIVASTATAVRTGIVPDAATCDACAAEITDPADRRFRYPFTNCTHCGPRLSIVRAIPYDRANTSMDAFPMCSACAAEYEDPADRRFHAQPNACPVCGPRVWLADAAGRELASAAGDGSAADAVETTSRLLAGGTIVAIKGIGGFHLACDATNAAAVAELRRRKRRYAKPFALMARDLDVIRRYCSVDLGEAELLTSAAAPIVLLDIAYAGAIAAGVAPGQQGLGFMLPYSPLHHLLLADWDRPLVMTSGNLSDEPQCIDNDDALRRLARIADAWLLHDRDIANRVDDSVARFVGGAPRWLRRARGAAPAPLALPAGLTDAEPVLALGGELKNTLCVLQHEQAILSQHLGDLDEARTAREFERTIDLYLDLFQHRPARIAVDLHPDYRSTLVGRALAERLSVPLVQVQHHAAHLAAVLADNGRPLTAGPVLGLILDGLGYGSDGTIWGGELLLGDYRAWRRAGHLRQVPLPGGDRATREPWRNLYAQLTACVGWDEVRRRWGDVAAVQGLSAKPVDLLARMVKSGIGSPLSSSAGRLFDAVAAAVGLCFDGIGYEGQAAIELETLARRSGRQPGYPFAVSSAHGGLVLDPAPLWPALLDDLASGADAGAIAARFHAGFAEGLCGLAAEAASGQDVDTVALSGGVFQNRTLFEAVAARLRDAGLQVLTHRRVPTNDGGIALGQAVMAAAATLPEGRDSKT